MANPDRVNDLVAWLEKEEQVRKRKALGMFLDEFDKAGKRDAPKVQGPGFVIVSMEAKR